MSIDPIALREQQARRYWELEIVKKIGFETFEDYLANVPKIPGHIVGITSLQFVLVDTRFSLDAMCKRLNIGFFDRNWRDGDENVFNKGDIDQRITDRGNTFWICTHNGRKYRGLAPEFLPGTFSYERKMTIMMGVCTYAQIPDIYNYQESDAFYDWDESENVREYNVAFNGTRFSDISRGFNPWGYPVPCISHNENNRARVITRNSVNSSPNLGAATCIR